MHLRKINKNKELIVFQPTYSSSGLQVAGAFPSCSGHKVGRTTLDRMPLHRWVHHTLTLIQTGTIQTCRSPHMGIFGMWEETGENPGRHEENVLTPHRHPSVNQFFSHQRYNKTIVEGLLCPISCQCLLVCFYGRYGKHWSILLVG